ncbi:hypothetical protein M413DRAFT_424844 [Hebeloma cylindrosporum]|uniref:Uncharacterized protein n=1 Tax=Hebeloma cylindrosporum TaxID=76867 RepID=A0A0C3BWM1_HEBCY|nr:hypothetical protein M413DRAFT_424844 [Hebeloma cylindrosporum h7]
MSASRSAKEPKGLGLLQGILQSLKAEYSAKQCSESATPPGQFCEHCAHLKAVDEKLFVHFDDMSKLLRTKVKMKERANQHHDRLTRRLPAEMVSYIFAIYTEDVNSNFDPRDPIVERGPLLLGAVSKSWRRIAFSTPQLWNTININILPNDDLTTQVELTKEWLARSRQLPLHISLVSEESDTELDPNPLIPLCNVLQNVSSRWCRLVLGISATLYSTFLGDVTCAPTLEALQIIDHDDSSSESNKSFYLPHTPLLKDVNIHLHAPFSCISIDWSNLIKFEANPITIDEYFYILPLSDGLECFRLGGIFGCDEALPTTPLTHSTLREFYIETNAATMNSSDMVTMLELVEFPSLVKFGYHSGSSTFPNSAISSLFTRSRCRLTHFALSGNLMNCTSDDLISILSDLPTITDLKLEAKSNRKQDNAIMSNKLLRRLTPANPSDLSTDRLLPLLESLEFKGYKTFSWGRLASLVSATTSDSRRDPSFPTRLELTNSIRSISFELYGVDEKMERVDAQSLAQFKSAQEAGIFHCQALGDFADRVRGWMFMF